VRFSVWVVCAAALANAGCEGDTACIQWSEQDGACPAREEALDYMQPRCEDPIESVDSNGEFEGQACCYEITKAEAETCETEE
jgi:hypothetical protein